MDCRSGCAACCIAPSISSAIPGMPDGKPAGVACVQLDGQLRCRLFGRPERPPVCRTLRPEPAMCGGSRNQALAWLAGLEQATAPAPVAQAHAGVTRLCLAWAADRADAGTGLPAGDGNRQCAAGRLSGSNDSRRRCRRTGT